jgi:hypothetical protein
VTEARSVRTLADSPGGGRSRSGTLHDAVAASGSIIVDTASTRRRDSARVAASRSLTVR